MSTMENKTTLQLSLKKKWFEMTKAGIKTEEYREITPYWANRLFDGYNQGFWNYYLSCDKWNPLDLISTFKRTHVRWNVFDNNKMTLGYPKKTDTERIVLLENKGIEIRTGNPKWGAEPNKLYFVIKHGKIKDNN